MPEKYTRKHNSNCLICNKSIYRRPLELKKTNGQAFCSSACFGISCRREVPCVVCGKMILSGLHKKTCSRGCSNIHRTGIQYKLNRPKDKVKTQQALKVRLLTIRGKKCERCRFDISEILQVHHKDRNRTNNTLENLELICPNCHCKEHYLKN